PDRFRTVLEEPERPVVRVALVNAPAARPVVGPLDRARVADEGDLLGRGQVGEEVEPVRIVVLVAASSALEATAKRDDSVRVLKSGSPETSVPNVGRVELVCGTYAADAAGALALDFLAGGVHDLTTLKTRSRRARRSRKSGPQSGSG